MRCLAIRGRLHALPFCLKDACCSAHCLKEFPSSTEEVSVLIGCNKCRTHAYLFSRLDMSYISRVRSAYPFSRLDMSYVSRMRSAHFGNEGAAPTERNGSFSPYRLGQLIPGHAAKHARKPDGHLTSKMLEMSCLITFVFPPLASVSGHCLATPDSVDMLQCCSEPASASSASSVSGEVKPSYKSFRQTRKFDNNSVYATRASELLKERWRLAFSSSSDVTFYFTFLSLPLSELPHSLSSGSSSSHLVSRQQARQPTPQGSAPPSPCPSPPSRS